MKYKGGDFFNFKNPFALPKCIKKVFRGLNLPTCPEFSFSCLSEIELWGRGRCPMVIQYTVILYRNISECPMIISAEFLV